MGAYEDLTGHRIKDAALALARAETERRAIPPLSATLDNFSVEDAYAVQRAGIELKIEAGQKMLGHKIGLTSQAMQRFAGFHEPDYGVLMDSMFYDDGAAIPANRFITPLLECELAFVLARPLEGGSCTIFNVLAATDFVVPAVEIVDLRTLPEDPITLRKRTVLDSIADNAANAALVLGGRPVRPDKIDLRWIAAVCRRNLVIEETGVSSAVLNHPAQGVAWLVKKLALHGERLEAGEIVLGGSFTRVIPARAGDQFHVDYGPLGCVTCHFV